MEGWIAIFNENRSWIMPVVLFGLVVVLLIQARVLIKETTREQGENRYLKQDLSLKKAAEKAKINQSFQMDRLLGARRAPCHQNQGTALKTGLSKVA